jgi:GlpG protein
MNNLAWHGQLWRLITSTLPHVNFLHLAFNLYWLWVFGTLVEEIFGHVRAAAVILLLAVGSSAAEYAVTVGGVGLSGVGYGLFGLLWMLSRTDNRFWGSIDSQTIALFVGWFFLCCVLTYLDLWSVGNVAHLSGAALGALLGLAIGWQGRRRRIAVGLLSGLMILIFVAATYGRRYVNLSNTVGQELAARAYEEQTRGHTTSAVELYRKALAIDSCQATWWFNLGIAYQQLGQTERAIDAYEHAVALKPNDDGYRHALDALRTFRDEAADSEHD